MASGKKGKKTKGKTLALTDFLQETTGSLPVQPIRKSNINWADDVDDFDGYDSHKPVNVVLPTAPKASRDYDDISDKVPKEPPYMAYLSNLPYDVDEDEIALFFKNMKIANMRIPKDDRDGNKLKGFGYVEFEDRDSLLNALVIPDTTLKNRRIRIEVAANSENDRRRGRMDMGRDRGDRGESFGDWRSGPRTETSEGERRGGFGGRDRDHDGGFTRDNMRGGDREEKTFSRDNMRSAEDRSFSRDNMRDRDSGFSRDRDSGFNRDRDSGFNRDRDSGFNRDRDSGFNRDRDNKDSFRKDRDGLDDRPGAWRDNDRVGRDQDRPGFTRDRGAFRDSDRGRYEDRDDRRGFGGRRFDSDRDRNGGFSRGGDRDSESTNSEPRERRKLVLAPRTKPVENVPVKADAVPSAAIFGNAKPVDTSQREREIEEKLAKKELTGSRDGSGERKAQSSDDTDKKSIERSRPPRKIDESPKRTYEEKKPPRSDHKSPVDKTERPKPEKPKKEEKRERHEKEMPKLSEPEPPNFAANNKFAFLQTEDYSD